MPPRKVSEKKVSKGEIPRGQEDINKETGLEIEAVPEDVIQDTTPQGSLSPIHENLVTTAAAASTSDKHQQDSSEDFSDHLYLERKNLNPTTAKKSQIEQRNSPIKTSIPFNLTMGNFDKPLLEVLDGWMVRGQQC